MLQLLAQVHCHSEVCVVLCSDRLSLFFHSLHRLFQCWMSHTCEVSGQVRPRSPAGTALLPESIRHLILRLHQPDTCTRVCLMMTPSEGRLEDAACLWANSGRSQDQGGPSSANWLRGSVLAGRRTSTSPVKGRKRLECSCVLFRGSRCVSGSVFLCVGELLGALRLHVTLSVVRLQVQLHQPPAQGKTLLFDRH